MRVIAGLVLILGLTSCAEREQEIELQRWVGVDPHFRAVGALGAQDLTLDDLIEVTCALDWEVPVVDGQPQYEHGRITELRAEGIVGDRAFELALERDELRSSEALGSGLIVFETLTGEMIPESGRSSAWLQASWSPNVSVTLTFTVPCEEGTVEFVP
jgi:hypothetical protein